MLRNRLTNFTIKEPEEVSEMPSHMYDDLREMLLDAYFLIPEKIIDNQKKIIYKVGYLKIIYSLLYPDFSNVKIYSLINIRWQIFKSVRQMERLYAQYVELKKKGEI